MEKIYIGTKIVMAEPMSEWEWLQSSYTSHRGLSVPDKDRPGYKIRYEDGYVSWSPKETFEKANRELSANEFNLISFVAKKEKEG